MDHLSSWRVVGNLVSKRHQGIKQQTFLVTNDQRGRHQKNNELDPDTSDRMSRNLANTKDLSLLYSLGIRPMVGFYHEPSEITKGVSYVSR